MSSSQLQAYAELTVKYENLKIEMMRLKEEYQENTIIQSMNDMKVMYDELVQKMDKVANTVEDINQIIKAVELMIETIIDNNSVKYELKTKLEFINEMLNKTLKLKHDLYFIIYD